MRLLGFTRTVSLEDLENDDVPPADKVGPPSPATMLASDRPADHERPTCISTSEVPFEEE
jgi:hypothetical protein